MSFLCSIFFLSHPLVARDFPLALKDTPSDKREEIIFSAPFRGAPRRGGRGNGNKDIR
ncbi:MAG: hypothetical protein Q8S84_02825 [bacterium]|nr:hypothetical protein [bacterium]MDP3380469.1 hypothetical protein [bacterium]